MAARGIDGTSLRNPVHETGPHLVGLANHLSEGEADFVLLHECAHLALGKEASEDQCDAFASEFLLASQMRRSA